MARRVHYKDGTLAVYDDTTPAALTDPLNNLSSVYFHSALDYLHIVYDQTVTFALPSTGTTNGSFDTYSFPNHNLGYTPFGFLATTGTQYPTNHPIQLLGNEGTGRYIHLALDNSTASLRVAHHATSGKSNPAINITARCILLGEATATDPVYAGRYDPSNGRVTLGRGKFDTNRSYLRRNDASPDFRATSGRTIDTNDSGARFMLPNGTVFDVQNYIGSFAGTQFFGLAD